MERIRRANAERDVDAAFLHRQCERFAFETSRQQSVAVEIKLPDAQSATALTVDESTGDNPPRTDKPINGILKLEPFAVSVVTW